MRENACYSIIFIIFVMSKIHNKNDNRRFYKKGFFGKKYTLLS